MKKLSDMSHNELHQLLQMLINDDFFQSREGN